MLSLIKRKAPANQPDKNAGAPGTETDSSSPVELVARMREVCRAATTGDIEQRITNIEPANELAELAWDINALLDIVDSYTRETSASMASASEGKFFRKIVLRGLPGEFRRSSEVINTASDIMATQTDEIPSQRERQLKIADKFEEVVGSVIGEVSEAAENMQKEAKIMAAAASETTERSTTVAAATEEASTNVQAVASATEELTSTINEVSARAAEASQTTERAQAEANQSRERLELLTQSAGRIDEVVTFINEISAQTNLLALNATIEAARADDAGKGFAVVATEVKSLAAQTTKAPEEIAAQVQGVQDATNQVSSALQAVGSTVVEITGDFNGNRRRCRRTGCRHAGN
jgi:methyl-accepting chemotaxis protein